MKRQDIFLLTYIVFIFVCVIVHNVTDYEAWNSIVAAVSFSSMFLAYADTFLTIRKAFREKLDLDKKRLHYTTKRMNAEKEAIEIVTNDIHSINKEACEITELKSELEKMKNVHKKIQWEVDFLEREISKMSQRIKRVDISANVMYFLGFFSFLCILIFYPNTDDYNDLQTTISVVAFAIVLSTQWVESMMESILEKRKQKTEDKVELCNRCIEEIEDIKHKVNAFVESVNK